MCLLSTHDVSDVETTLECGGCGQGPGSLPYRVPETIFDLSRDVHRADNRNPRPLTCAPQLAGTGNAASEFRCLRPAYITPAVSVELGYCMPSILFLLSKRLSANASKIRGDLLRLGEVRPSRPHEVHRLLSFGPGAG
jgi:hypothetical protein